jgi:hypothetical protein
MPTPLAVGHPPQPDDALRRLRKARKRAKKQLEMSVIPGFPDWALALIAFLTVWLILGTLGLFIKAFAWIQIVVGVLLGLAAWVVFGHEMDRDPRGVMKGFVAMGAGVLMVLTGALLAQL